MTGMCVIKVQLISLKARKQAADRMLSNSDMVHESYLLQAQIEALEAEKKRIEEAR